MNLNQRNFFTKRKFDFEELGLVCSVTGILGNQVVHIPYEEIIITKTIKQSQKNSGALILTMIFCLLLLFNFLIIAFGENNYGSWEGTIVLSFFTILSFVMLFATEKKEILIPTSHSGLIILFNNNSKREETDKFLDDLKSRINNYLKKKYGQIDKDLPIELQLNNLIWLNEREVISKEEFSNLKDALLNKNPNKEFIGFRNQ